MAKAPVLKTGGRKPLQVRILCPPLYHQHLEANRNLHTRAATHGEERRNAGFQRAVLRLCFALSLQHAAVVQDGVRRKRNSQDACCRSDPTCRIRSPGCGRLGEQRNAHARRQDTGRQA